MRAAFCEKKRLLPCGLVLHENPTRPEKVDIAPVSRGSFDGFLEGCDSAALDAEEDGAMTDLIPERHAADSKPELTGLATAIA